MNIPNKQFMFHFAARNSIDARVISNDDKEWCIRVYQWHQENNLTTYRDTEYITVMKLLKLYYPEELI